MGADALSRSTRLQQIWGPRSLRDGIRIGFARCPSSRSGVEGLATSVGESSVLVGELDPVLSWRFCVLHLGRRLTWQFWKRRRCTLRCRGRRLGGGFFVRHGLHHGLADVARPLGSAVHRLARRASGRPAEDQAAAAVLPVESTEQGRSAARELCCRLRRRFRGTWIHPTRHHLHRRKRRRSVREFRRTWDHPAQRMPTTGRRR